MGSKTTLPGSLHASSYSHRPPTNKLAFSSSPSASRQSSHVLILDDSSNTSMLSSDDGDADDGDAVIVTSIGDAEISAPRRDVNGSTNDGVEDVCLACRGECQCGGARGDPIFFSPLEKHGSSSRGSSPTSNRNGYPRFSGKTLTGSPASASARGSPELGDIPKRRREDAADESEEEGDHEEDDDDIGRPRLELQKIHNSHIAVLPATLPPLPTLPYLPTLPTVKAALPSSSRTTSPKPTPSPPLASTSGTSTRICFRTTTPQRLTLRQVLALSAKEAESDSVSAQSSVNGDALDDERYRKIADARALMKSQDPDSSDLSGEVDDDDGPEHVVMDEVDIRMEKSEEKALRKEIEEKKRRFGLDSDARSEARSEARSDRNKNSKPTKIAEETEEDVAAAWKANVEALNRVRARTLGEAKSGVVVADASIEIDEDDELGVTDLPIVGGSGVVTWSDYEDLDEFETIDTTDEEDANIVIPREEEHIEMPEEQEKSLAMDLEEELEELLAISESVVGPIRHDELESGDMWFEAVSDVEADGGATADVENDGDSSADDDSDDDEDESVEGGETLLFVDGIEGWTTAAGAMAALRRRAESGFESHDDEAETDDDADEDGEEDDDDDDIDLLELDDDGGETTDSMASDALLTRFGAPSRKAAADFDDDSGESTDSDPEASKSANAVASTSSAVLTTEGEARGKEMGKGKGKELAEASARAVPQDATTPQAPAMGVFVAKRKNRSTKKAVKVVVIDASTALVPSPFSRARKSQLDRLTRTTRADSKTSTSTGSISGETVEAEVEIEVEFDLDELLNDDLLESLSPSSATSVSTFPTTGEKVKSTPKGLSDFARWSRVPIGAFRSRTTPHQIAFNYDEFDLVHGGTAQTTLSSPGVPNYSTKRSVEKRMLTSPVMGPSSVSAKNGKKKGNNGHGNKRLKLGHNAISPFVAAPKNSPWL